MPGAGLTPFHCATKRKVYVLALYSAVEALRQVGSELPVVGSGSNAGVASPLG